MADVTLPNTLTNGTADADQVMANFAAIVAAVNNLDDANIAAAANIDAAKLLDASVVLAKLAGNSVDASKLAGNSVDASKLEAALATIVGVSQSGMVRRGKSIIATEEARTNVAYGLLTTPDRVSGIVLPTDGLIAVAYHAAWKESVLGAGRAAIFVGANQLKVAHDGSGAVGPVIQAAQHDPASGGLGGAANVYRPLASGGLGLAASQAPLDYGADVTTGQAVGMAGTINGITMNFENGMVNFGKSTTGGPTYIYAAAGTYDISVQFKSSSGSVTAKNRKLWVWSVGF